MKIEIKTEYGGVKYGIYLDLSEKDLKEIKEEFDAHRYDGPMAKHYGFLFLEINKILDNCRDPEEKKKEDRALARKLRKEKKRGAKNKTVAIEPGEYFND